MISKKPKGIIFDLNGTMIDDMNYHASAWSGILNNDLNAGLSDEEVRRQMYGKNEEVLGRIFGKEYFSSEELKEISIEKERRYQEAYLPHLKLIDGLPEFLAACKEKGLPMAIASAAITSNIDFVLDNLRIRQYFSAIVSADDVQVSKPDPEVFLQAAKLLGLQPENCIVFEDAPKGVEAALRAKMSSIVVLTTHSRKEFSFMPNVISMINNYNDPMLVKLLAGDMGPWLTKT
ncbi:MAG TPA: HAD family phosphatase [Puia sp.]|nr:HAD family phosphatase [Puia sp.]